MGGAIGSPSTAYIYDWNMLPIGQALWLKELESYDKYPPLQDPASYNLDQVILNRSSRPKLPVAATSSTTQTRRASYCGRPSINSLAQRATANEAARGGPFASRTERGT